MIYSRDSLLTLFPTLARGPGGNPLTNRPPAINERRNLAGWQCRAWRRPHRPPIHGRRAARRQITAGMLRRARTSTTRRALSMSRVNDLLLRLHSRRIVRRTASVTEANVQGWDFAMMDLFVGTTSHLHNSTSIGELAGGLSAAYSSVRVEVPT